MATSLSFCEYVCEQIRGNYDVRFRKMFGEYMIYLNEKPVILVCDDIPFIKMLPELKEFAEGLDTGFPYDGAKELFRLGVCVIAIPLCSLVLANIIQEIMAAAMTDVVKAKLEGWASVGLGAAFIVMSLMCRYGSELKDKSGNADAAETEIKDDKKEEDGKND